MFHLVSLLGAQEVSGNMFRQHVGHQSFIPASHLIDLLLLLVDFNLPQEQSPGQFLHLQFTTGTIIIIINFTQPLQMF